MSPHKPRLIPLFLGMGIGIGMLACSPEGDGIQESITLGEAGDELGDTGSEAEDTGSDGTDDGWETCDQHGVSCGEQHLCICDGDLADSCGCDSLWCDAAEHCTGDELCVFEALDPFGSGPRCIPGMCGQDIEALLATGDADVSEAQGRACMLGLSIVETSWTEVPSFAELRLLVGDLYIRGNPALSSLAGLGALEELDVLTIFANDSLTSLDGLASLQRVSGGVIRDNPSLPATDIAAFLAGVEGGELVTVCGNLGGDPC